MVWGVAQGVPRLVNGLRLGAGLTVVGVPSGRARSMRDRVWAALEGTGMPLQGPARVTVQPRVQAGRCHSLDAAIALAVLSATGALVGPGSAMVWGSLGPRGEIRPVSDEDGAVRGYGAAMIAVGLTGRHPRPVSSIREVMAILNTMKATRIP